MRVVRNMATNSEIERPEEFGRSLAGLHRLLPYSAEILERLSDTDVGQIGFSEYFDFRLYAPDLSMDATRAFGGRKVQGILEDILIDDYARFLSLDKITMYGLLANYGFPGPKKRAVYRSPRRTDRAPAEGP